MKIKSITFIVLLVFFTTGMALSAESAATENSAAIGLGLEPTPLPELLAKHLLLKPGQGLRIVNIMKGSAADEAGIERDDIVVGFQGKELYDSETLTNAMLQASVGTEVSLEIIHLGQRKTIKMKLKAASGYPEWKYPDEPQIEQIFQPGRVFRFGPGDQDWTQIFDNQILSDIRSNINSSFNEISTSFYNVNGKQYSVTIEGNPDNKDSKITVKIDNDEYKTTIGELDKIPQAHRQAAKNAIENAKQRRLSGTIRSPRLPNRSGINNMPRLRSQNPQSGVPDNFNSSTFERMEEQMKQLQERLKEMEMNQKKLLERLNEKQEPKI